MLQVVAAMVLLAMVWLGFRTYRNPGIALGLMWSTYALEQFLQYVAPIFVRYGSLLNFAMVGLVLGSILSAMAAGKMKRFRLSKAHYWWAALILLACISTTWSPNPSYSWVKLKIAIPYIVGFSVLAPFCASDQVQVDKAIRVSVYFGGLVLLGTFFCSFGSRSLVIAYDSAGNAIEGNPLAMATYGGYVFITCVFSFYAWSGNQLTQALKIAIAILATYVIVRTGSRGQLIAVFAVCFVWVPITAEMALKRANIFMLAVGFVVLVGVLYLASSFVEQQSDLLWRWRTGRLQQDQEGRFELTTLLLKEYYAGGFGVWLFGLGGSASFYFLKTYSHVVPLEVLGEEGLIGLIILAGFILIVFRSGFKVMRKPDLPQATRVNMGALMCLFSFHCLLLFKQGTLLGSPEFFCMGLCMAISSERILASDRRKAKQLAAQYYQRVTV